MEDVRPVGEHERLDWARLERYLRERLPSCGVTLAGSGPLEAARFSGGHSNLTYRLRLGDTELVLRRPPFGQLPPAAHDMAREYRWLTALNPTWPLAPRPFLLCEDMDVIGSTFYVMERRHGVVLRHGSSSFPSEHAARRAISACLVQTLANLHAIDPDAPGVSALGKSSGFVERQVRGWTERWQRSQTEPVPDMDAVAAWLARHVPTESAATIVHGDFKLDNVMLDHTLGCVVGVFDWEMCALGDPLVDIGILLAYWPPVAPPGAPAERSGDRAGWFTEQELLDCYQAASGRDVSGIGFYRVYALFKVAAVLQQIFHRFSSGETDDQRFAGFDARVRRLAHDASRLAARAEGQ